MAFRKFRRGTFHRRRSMPRRANPYELAQISICRSGLELGLTDCLTPDQFFHHIASYAEWMSSRVFNASQPGEILNASPAHAGKSITVRGIQFDYQYSLTPQPVGEEETATGVLSIRTALVVLKIANQGSSGQLDPRLPANPPANLLFTNQTTRANAQSTIGSAALSSDNRFRMLWRGMEMMGTVLSDQMTVFEAGEIQVPNSLTQSRHVRVRTGCRLDRDEALFLVTEVVNPFLSSPPTIALDLFGSLVVKTNFRGPSRYDTTS